MLTYSTNEFLIIAGVIIWILGFLGGMLPLCCGDISPNFRSVLHMLAGGVFFAASTMHLLPDALHNEELLRLGCNSDITTECNNGDLWAFFFFGVGFLLILYIEIFAHTLQSKLAYAPLPNEFSPVLFNKNTKRQMYNDLESSESHSVAYGHISALLGKIEVVTFLVFVSLSFHSVMEGIAIGSQTHPAWDIFIAVIAHKALVGFSLGLEMQIHNVTKIRLFYSILIFSLMSPFGIVIGWLLIGGLSTSSSSSSDEIEESISSGICTALSAGTFLYVAVMEIIPQELQNRKNQFIKSAALCSGFLIFGLLAKWI